MEEQSVELREGQCIKDSNIYEKTLENETQKGSGHQTMENIGLAGQSCIQHPTRLGA